MSSATPLRSQPVRVLAVASVDLRGILRSHPFRIFLPVGLLLVLAAPSLVLFAFDVRDAMIAQLGVSTAALFALFVGLVAGAGSLASDRETGRASLVLSRPIGAGAWLLGKWLAILVAVALAVAAIGAAHFVSLAFRGGPPHGYGPLALALLVAAGGGGLGGALALAFSTRLKPAAAFLGALLVDLSGHAVVLAGTTPFLKGARFVLPGTPWLNLGSEAAFGTLTTGVSLFALSHALLYSLFVLALGAWLVERKAGGEAG